MNWRMKVNKFATLKSTLLLVATLIISACATTEKLSSGIEVITQSEYENIIAKNTEKAQVYESLYNVLDVSGTIMNSQMTAAQLSQSARLYLWDKTKLDSETAAKKIKTEKELEIFISFYTPDRKNDDLAKNKTLWKIFLDLDGKRYEGKATKVKLLLSEIQGLYPYHTKFATPYSIVFPISASLADGKSAKLILTGAVGSASLNFNGANNKD